MPEVSTSTRPMDTLKERYEDVKRRVESAALSAGRRAEDVLIVAVTKYASPEQIRELIEMGHADFGENRVQQLTRRVAAVEEFLERHKTMTPSRPVSLPPKVRWHMIGHLQRNKVKKALELTTLIHTVDTLRLAEEIQECALRREAPVDVLMQVNASFERQKSGVAMPAAAHLAEQIDSMVHLRLRGLMTMAPLTDDREAIRGAFERCADCFGEIRKQGIGGKAFNILSMGMTSDFEIAIECGANLVRIGTAIFGDRQHLDADPDRPDGEPDED
ncbi:MAG: YggS family pyridoxal phosphate-dependent enzyme [Phycisphaerales bacterium]|nr:YggS family pyridoxal phosphate-dependent enzyme [Phycisphaerales bacterium]